MNIRDLKVDAEIFKTRREMKELSVRDVEESTGVNRSTISNLENGVNIPDGYNLLRLMFFFDLSKEEIALKQ